MNWFEVDRKGLTQLVAARGKVFIVYELLQNSFDEDGVTEVEVKFEPVPGRPEVLLEVTDDSPNGFRQLSDAWTMFAASYKKANAGKRGRFNVGEKLVLALCEEAHIITTTGSVHFTDEGRTVGRQKRDRGTLFQARIAMTRAEYDEACRDAMRVIPPEAIKASFNGSPLLRREIIASFEATLPTVIGDELRRTERKTTVRVYTPLADELPSIYEMGIPVVETGDTFHVDVDQKVPLNMDRDNVPPSYLRALRVLVMNATSHLITQERAASTEAQEALGDARCDVAAANAILTQRFGEKRFTYDPSDPEANHRLMAEGYTPIQGGSLNGQQWANVKRYNLSRPAGELAPSPRPYAENGRPENVVPPSEWTEGMRRIAGWAMSLAPHLIDRQIEVKIAREPAVFWSANYGSGVLTLNLSKLGHRRFDEFPARCGERAAAAHPRIRPRIRLRPLERRLPRRALEIGGQSRLPGACSPGVIPPRLSRTIRGDRDEPTRAHRPPSRQGTRASPEGGPRRAGR